MQTTGFLSPKSENEVDQLSDVLGPTAQVLVKEVAKAMEFDAAEYDERVTTDVVQTARDALFASLLEVHVGSRAEFDEWAESFDGEVVETGSDNVDNVAWHAAEFADMAVAATFQNEEQAAVATLRRQAFGRIYAEWL
ncbi:DUF5809 family protein [Halostella pelagica]|uniref:DUF5809 family protein n=1 Tax=Halostella pelagica TaxID=2583824 RepID=UPI0010817E62|nr:DUF5809 family protein [Halostella pelagica]